MARGLIVADASALIALAKIGRLRLLRVRYGGIIIGSTLEDEVITAGRRAHVRGMVEIEQALAQRWLRIVVLTAAERRRATSLRSIPGLDAGEAEALSIALNRNLRVIIDDKEARHAAETLGISYLGTVGVLLEAHQQAHLTLDEFEDAITSLTGILWLSPSVVATALRIARGGTR
jgi:predicted nucleic acid-binding protein